MECRVARQLIDDGMGSQAPRAQQAALDIHLAGCAECRAYREQLADTLLHSLLDTPPAVRRAASVPTLRSSALRPTGRRAIAKVTPKRPRPWYHYVLFGVLFVIIGGFGLLFGQLAFAAYTISQNVAAMQIDRDQPVVVATPALQLPSSIAPTATALSVLVVPSPSPIVSVPAIGASAVIAAEVPNPTEAASPAPTSAVLAQFVPTITPISLPSIGSSNTNSSALPTLIPTAGIVPVSGESINILLLGSDRRPGESWATRSDAIVVVHLDPQTQRIAMLSLPRDLVVPIPGYGSARINGATVYGDTYPELGGGAELARRTVSEFLGIPIAHVLRSDFAAFTKAIDAIGGVYVNVEEELYDPLYPTMDYGYMEAYFSPGLQYFDGDTALIYSRMRHMDSNYARNRRQQQVLLAIMDRVREQNLLSQVQMITDLTSALRDDIQTDLSLDEMLGLAWAFRHAAPDMVERYALDETMVVEGVLADDPYATFAQPGAVEHLVQLLIYGQGN